MNRSACSLAVLVLLSGTALAQQTVKAGLSPLPIWPANGAIPQELSGQYAFFDPRSDQLVLAYPGNSGQADAQRSAARLVKRVDLGNQPRAAFSLSVQSRGGYFDYHYRVTNAAQARQPIMRFDIAAPSLASDEPMAAPLNWNAAAGVAPSATATRTAVLLNPGLSAVRLNWRAARAGIAPGTALEGFRVTSALKPGFTHAHVSAAQPLSLGNDIPEAVRRQAAPLLKMADERQQILTLGPKYPAYTPKLRIVADFHFVIDHLVRRGQLKGDSAAVRETLAGLADYLAAAARQPDVPIEDWVGPPIVLSRATPRQGLEADILNALKLSLD